jgi:hypothetical protein
MFKHNVGHRQFLCVCRRCNKRGSAAADRGSFSGAEMQGGWSACVGGGIHGQRWVGRFRWATGWRGPQQKGKGGPGSAQGIESATGYVGRIASRLASTGGTQERGSGAVAYLKASRGRGSGVVWWCGVVPCGWVCRGSTRHGQAATRRGGMRGGGIRGKGGYAYTHVLAGWQGWLAARRGGEQSKCCAEQERQLGRPSQPRKHASIHKQLWAAG